MITLKPPVPVEFGLKSCIIPSLSGGGMSSTANGLIGQVSKIKSYSILHLKSFESSTLIEIVLVAGGISGLTSIKKAEVYMPQEISKKVQK